MAESIPKAKSAYAFFQAAMNKQMVGVPLETLKLNAGERMQEISARWKALDDKAPYEAQAAADKRRYEEASVARDAQVLAEQEAKRKAREGGGRGTKRAAAPVSEAPKPKKERKPRVLSEKQQAERSAKQSERSARESRMDAEREALDGRLADAAQARLKFLLSQSDIFGHFGAGATAAAASKKKETQEVKSPVKRRARTLEEDDLETKEEAEATTRLSRQPSNIKGGQMRPYQLEGLNWMIRLYDHGMNGILADEMGLGKTLQCISMLAWLREGRKIEGPHLILVPKSTLGNWMNEFARWCPEIRAVRFHGPKPDRAAFVRDVLKPGASRRDYDVVVTTYEVANAEQKSLEKVSWRFVVIDEAHRIKNEASLFARTARSLRAERRLLVTGTPLQNNLHELWALLNFLLPDVFASSDQFDEWFDLDVDDDDAKKTMISQLHKLLRPFVLRRLKADVERSMPPKTETILFASLTKCQRDVYKSLLKRDASLLGKEDGSCSRASIANIAMQLRKCCNHPYLFQGVEDRTLDPLGEHVIDACGKLKLMDKLLSRLKEKGHRVLIFSQMTHLLDVLEDVMAMRKYEYCRIDGNTSYDERDEFIEEYNKPNSSKFVFLLSTRAGGLGINLQTADACILFDSDWNPQADLQAMDRCHRIGQTKPVHVYRLVTAETIEEKIVERAKKKLKLDAMVVQQGRLNQEKKPQGPSKDEMLEAVTFGASAIFRAEGDVKDEDLDAILERGRERTKLLDEKFQQDDKGDMLDFKLDGGQYTQTFEGVNYAQRQKQDLDALKTAAAVTALEGPGERKKSAYNAQAVLNAQEYQAKEAAKKRNPVPPKHRMPRLDDWAFLDVSRLSEIGKLETEGFTSLLGDPQKYKEVGNSECGVLEPSVKAEKDRLLEAGFRQWTKERFMQWRRLSAQHGRHAHDKITAGLQGVAPGIEIREVKAFHTAFFDQKKAEKWRDQAEYSRALRQIERGEKATIDSKKNDSAFEELVSSAVEEGNALDALPIDGGGPATQIRDDERPYTRSEDRFLLTASYLLKDTDGHALSAAMRSTDRFLFDRRILGASHNDLAARCVALKSKCEGVRASRERQAQKALEKKRAVRPAHIVEAELRALEPKLKQAKREESQATDEWKKLERDIRGLSSRSAPRPSLLKPEPRQLRLKPFVYYVRERGASLVAGAELPERDDMEPAVEETLAMLETNWGGEGDAAKGELLSRVPSS